MALIRCVECGNQISDSAELCPHCGFPMREYISFKENEKKRILEEKERIENELKKEKMRIAEQERIANIKCHECGNVIGGVDVCPYCGFDMANYKKEQEIRQKEQEEYLRKINESKSTVNTSIRNVVRCPKCGSTQIQIVNRKFSFLTGFATNKVDRVCVNCKHKW